MGAGSALAAGALVHALPALAPIAPPVASALGLPTRLGRPHGTALTFDDGPHGRGTPAVLERLAAASVPAIFFLVGEQVMRRPDLAARIAAEGHEVALHGHRHRNLLRLTPRQIRDDLTRGSAAIIEATGQAPRYYRPPYGVFSAAGLRVVRRAGLRPLLWSRWGRDWAGRATPDSIALRLTGRVRPGDVLLLHDADHYSAAGSWQRTAAALPRILEALVPPELAPVRIAEVAGP